MQGISPWLAAAKEAFARSLPPLFHKSAGGCTFNVHNTGDALWIIALWPGGGRLAFRAAFAPDAALHLQKMDEVESEVTFRLQSAIGQYTVKLAFPSLEQPLFRCTAALTPESPLLIPFWPRDLVALGDEGDTAFAQGELYVHQVGPRSGLLYGGISRPTAGAFLYLQHLTALSDYCEQTETTVADTVGEQWPELGFALPPAKKKPLPAGKECVISDALILLSPELPVGEAEMSRQFLHLLADIYIHLPRPQTAYQHWPDVLEKTLHDLQLSPGCWTQVQGHAYLNAYVCDYSTPPEIMVQLAVLLPLLDYVHWSGREISMIRSIKAGLPRFYDNRIGSVCRWLPAAAHKLKGSEEHKQPRVMDAWYLHHPLLNLSRMALAGDKEAEKLLLDSLEYAIKVAHHFNYQWPVFYNLDTLEVIRAETQPGKGGEKDVPGLYAHVMLQAWELTGNRRYLEEAQQAARALRNTGFGLFYQANNTAFAAGAMLRLWKATRDPQYLDLSYLCLANIFKNVWLWDCNYGYGKHYPTFFALFPLNEAPYTAVYEEQEGFAAFHDYLALAAGEDILPAVTLLLSEYIRFMVYRAAFYYPPMLPNEMLAAAARTGELDPRLWIPVEDMYDGWTRSGIVGQEVYGAGLAFGIVPRHYHQVPGEPFMIFVDYPVTDFTIKEGPAVCFTLQGDERLCCRLLLLPLTDKALPAFSVKGRQREKGRKIRPAGYMEYFVYGGQEITISWKNELPATVPGTARNNTGEINTI